MDHAFMSRILAFIQFSVRWIKSFSNCIVNDPLLLCFVVLMFVGLGVGLIKRLMSL